VATEKKKRKQKNLTHLSRPSQAFQVITFPKLTQQHHLKVFINSYKKYLILLMYQLQARNPTESCETKT